MTAIHSTTKIELQAIGTKVVPPPPVQPVPSLQATDLPKGHQRRVDRQARGQQARPLTT